MIEKREKEEEERRRKKEEEERMASVSGEDEAVEFVTRKIGAAVSPFPLRATFSATKNNEDASQIVATGDSLLSPQGGGKYRVSRLYGVIKMIE